MGTFCVNGRLLKAETLKTVRKTVWSTLLMFWNMKRLPFRSGFRRVGAKGHGNHKQLNITVTSLSSAVWLSHTKRGRLLMRTRWLKKSRKFLFVYLQSACARGLGVITHSRVHAPPGQHIHHGHYHFFFVLWLKIDIRASISSRVSFYNPPHKHTQSCVPFHVSVCEQSWRTPGGGQPSFSLTHTRARARIILTSLLWYVSAFTFIF